MASLVRSVLLLTVLIIGALPFAAAQDKDKQPRKFDGVAHTGIHNVDGSTIPFFFDESRVEFPQADPKKPSSDDLLKSVATEGSQLKGKLGLVEAFAKQGLLKIGEKTADKLLAIIVYPVKGTKGKDLIKGPDTFSPGEIKSLKEVIKKHGEPIEKELWSAKMTREIDLDGVVNWWGEVGVAASKDGTITHVLVRQAPKKK